MIIHVNTIFLNNQNRRHTYYVFTLNNEPHWQSRELYYATNAYLKDLTEWA